MAETFTKSQVETAAQIWADEREAVEAAKVEAEERRREANKAETALANARLREEAAWKRLLEMRGAK